MPRRHRLPTFLMVLAGLAAGTAVAQVSVKDNPRCLKPLTTEEQRARALAMSMVQQLDAFALTLEREMDALEQQKTPLTEAQASRLRFLKNQQRETKALHGDATAAADKWCKTQ